MTSVPKPFVSKSTWLKIAAPFAGYAGEVATLVSRIARTQAGRAVLEGIRAGGGSVRIQPPERPTNPPNTWALPTAAEGEGARQVVVFYIPVTGAAAHPSRRRRVRKCCSDCSRIP